MGEYIQVRSKIVSWREVHAEPTFFALLACGHETPGPYDEGLTVEQRKAIERDGIELVCSQCERDADELHRAEQVVLEIRARQKARKKATRT